MVRTLRNCDCDILELLTELLASESTICYALRASPWPERYPTHQRVFRSRDHEERLWRARPMSSSSSSSLPSTSASVTPASLPDSSLTEWEGWIAQAASAGEDELYDELDDEIAYQFKVRIHTMFALVRVALARGVSFVASPWALMR